MSFLRTGTTPIGSHNRAIILSDEAYEAKRKRQYKSAKLLFAKAYDLERFAGETIDNDDMRYSLYLSAAIFAQHAGMEQEETWMRERVDHIAKGKTGGYNQS